MLVDDSARVYQLFVGADVAARTVTVVWIDKTGHSAQPLTVEQTVAGYAMLQQRLQVTGVLPSHTLVVLEATGSYWMTLATTLAHAGYAVSVVNPKQAHDFAKALLKHAKTDAIDAQTLAQLAALLHPAPWTPPLAVYTELQQRLTQRDALLSRRPQVRNQRHALIQHPVVVPAVRARLDALIGRLTQQINELAVEIAAVFRQDAAWAAAAVRLQTITGIGLISAAWLLVATLNFTLCPTPEAATAYAGLAPYARESGTRVRNRRQIGHTGHARLRTTLYLATLSATQHNPAIKPFYERLRAAGKPPKVARCAAARKLLHSAWAIGTKGTTFAAQYHRVRNAQTGQQEREVVKPG
jgi:transposase